MQSSIIQGNDDRRDARAAGILVKCGTAAYVACALCLFFSPNVHAQRISILGPEKNPLALNIVDELALTLSKSSAVVDNSLSEAAFFSEQHESPFNLSKEESKRIGSVIGCNVFLLIKAETLRRTSIAKTAYFESYAAVFVISSRSGHLIGWRITSTEADTAVESERRMLEALSKIGAEISQMWKDWLRQDAAAEFDTGYREVPAADSPDSKNFRAPVPYLRIKPQYTSSAYLYDVKGTVEVMVDLDEKGSVVKTEITRWAGFGLDEAVIDAVRKMNWRPAEQNGKPLPSRFLLRYNFKKIEKDPPGSS